MVEVYDVDGKKLLLRLLAAHPEWEGGLEAGIPSDDPLHVVHPKLHIPSAHPIIRTPLTIHLGGTLALYWHFGYFFDFIWKDIADNAFEFLQSFFAEEVRCGVRWLNGEVVGGGPVEEDGIPLWTGEFDRIEVRSWRGTRDEVAER